MVEEGRDAQSVNCPANADWELVLFRLRLNGDAFYTALLISERGESESWPAPPTGLPSSLLQLHSYLHTLSIPPPPWRTSVDFENQLTTSNRSRMLTWTAVGQPQSTSSIPSRDPGFGSVSGSGPPAAEVRKLQL